MKNSRLHLVLVALAALASFGFAAAGAQPTATEDDCGSCSSCAGCCSK